MNKETIKKLVENYFELKIDATTRKREYVEARAMYFKLTRDSTRLSLTSIGEEVNRHYASVLHGIRQLESWIEKDKMVRNNYTALKNKLTSNAIRVPVPNGSLAILNLKIKKNTTLKKINNLIKTAALTGNLVEQIKYELNDELVSSDVVGCTAPAIYDSKATIVRPDGKNVIMYIWYDNEFGYSHQVIRLSKYIAKVRRFTYY